MSTPDPRVDALHRLCGAVRPVWRAVATAGDLIGLPEGVLLHAGPPLRDPARPPAVLLSSAVMAVLHAGWATDEAGAERLVREGGVRLEPAQHWGGVLPLAAVATRATPLVEVIDDREGASARSWSLLSSGAGAQIRFGTREPALLERLVWRDAALAPGLAAHLERGGAIELWPLAREGLLAGDDLHAQTTHASAALARELQARGPLAPATQAMLAQSPLFFLTLWMATCHLLLQAAAQEPACAGLVLALAANGQDLGLRVAGGDGRWFTAPAPTPQGLRIGDAARPLSPMVGDSGVIDAAGFGAQAFGLAPALATLFAPWRQAVPVGGTFNAGHAALADAGPGPAALRAGLDAHLIARTAAVPEVAIAMLAADGQGGLAGRGIAGLPHEVFVAASAAVRNDHEM